MAERNSQEQVVVCSFCGDIVSAGAACATCGWSDPEETPTGSPEELDRGLLACVGATLQGSGDSGIAQGADDASCRVARGLALRRRMRCQAHLLRYRLRSQGALSSALDNVEHALDDDPAELPPTDAWSVRMPLPRTARCAVVARRLVEEYARTFVPRECDRALLIASELATNAYRHGTGEITLRLERHDDRLRIEVQDMGNGTGIGVAAPREAADSGMGLRVVEQLSTDWGVDAGQAHVWAELPIAA